MGGDLLVESTTGVGSTFTLRLPVWDRARMPAPARRVGMVEGTPRHVRLALGETLAACADAIAKSWADRLRADPDVPAARELGPSEVENHIGAFLADFAQHFVILDDPLADRASGVRDGARIQHVITMLHGIQRARLGWSEDAMRRELRLLGEVVEGRLREELGEAAEIEDSLALVRALLAEAGREAMRAFRDARGRTAAA